MTQIEKIKEEIIMHHDGTTAYSPGTSAVFLQTTDTSNIFGVPDREPANITVKGHDKETMPRMVPWGANNDLPNKIIEKSGKLAQMNANLWFNVLLSYGDGIKPVKITGEGENKKIEPYTGNDEIDRFFEENDMQLYLLEQMTDMHWFFNCYPEIIFNGEDGDKRKIVELRSKEASFSRWSEMNPENGRIEWHYYFAYWGVYQPCEKYPCTATNVLDHHTPLRHLREAMTEDLKKPVKARRNRFIVPVNFPSPGRNYYQKPYWYAIFEGGLYDFAMKILPFKDAIMRNQALINYIILLDPDYFKEIFRRESITGDKEQKARMKKEYKDINDFIKGNENSGKSIITFQKKDPAGQPYPMIKIDVVKNEMKDGAYIEDSEEVSNLIAYAMMTQPALVGPPPGKNKTINGTEARELFIIKQALMKPFRDRILRPLYLIKSINKWPADLHFVIPNLELTTLDNNKTGSVTKVNEPLK